MHDGNKKQMGRPVNNLTGRVFGLLTVGEYIGARAWHTTCACGKKGVRHGSDLLKGHTKSCGCATVRLISKARRKYGPNIVLRDYDEYPRYIAMLNRCHNPKNSNYAHYGARGIEVCARWRASFMDFLSDMGRRPPGLELDRIDNNGNYEPGNVRWATRSENNSNRRTNRFVTWRGRTQTVGEWAKELGLNQNMLGARFRNGWPPERAFTTPVQVHRTFVKRRSVKE